ncbi:phenylalanine--tRNA ligase subunit beta [Kibdelosporangium philippinense]|uniref:phenylalanine--tRNA ligase n=1 Tax=Kibdelosporangium philippinense TaxID=211113 RepID=A0ABS8Z4P7_9PSEU|nr:phenylalanine--tRNA ligase subunit beta [Kibdelosporangium philippinense]MCE7001944.1 phenylalanine--tRNA ligase subunit beta [Kibdelosporangium philippinense]
MKVSLEWLSDFVELPAESTPARLAHDLTLKAVEVDGFTEVDGDVVLEIDNKSLTNRPDLWGHYGIAREFAVIYDRPLAPLPTCPPAPSATHIVGTLDAELCGRFSATEFTVDGSVPTPAVVRDRLARIGEQSINLCVDLSNYVMFTVGQPTHVYDADRVRLPLSADFAERPGVLELLVGRTIDVITGMPVIRDADGVVAAAGVMGGASSAVSGSSQRFVLEAAAFRAGQVRRSVQRLGLRTEASARYEKELDTQRVDDAVGLFLDLLVTAAPDARITAAQDVVVRPTERQRIDVGLPFLARRIGTRLPDKEILAILGALGFECQISEDVLSVVAPTWRSTGDVSLPHDIVEEIARIHGYDRLPAVRPTVALNPVRSLNRKPLGRSVREQLAGRGGLTEVLTYPWSADHLLAVCGLDKAATVRIDGAPAPDRDSLRPSLVPNLLEAVADNLRYRKEFGVFEVGEVFSGAERVLYDSSGESLPGQTTALGIALAGTDGVTLFRRVKGLLEMLYRHCHVIELTLSGEPDEAWADPSARLAVSAGGVPVGALGLVRPRVCRAAGIEETLVACAELRLAGLSAHRSRDNRYAALPELPESDFDLSVVVADSVPWQTVEAVVLQGHELVSAVSYIGEYNGSWVPSGHRSLTLRVILRPRGTTLTAADIGVARAQVLEALAEQTGARLR